jgi:hypothetical protein
MPRPTSRQVGTGLVTRGRTGDVRRGCRRCGQWSTAASWREGVREARAHAASHQRVDARYLGAPHTDRRNLPQLELRTRRGWRRRLAAACGVLVLAVLASAITMASIAPRAGSAPPPTTTPAPYEYVPTPAGPPSSLPAGGDR